MKKRQLLRRGLLFLSFFTFPLTIFYFSPYLPVMGAARGIIAGSLFTFSVLFITSLFLGRIFCAYLCPAGGMEELLSPLNNRPVRKLRWTKYVLWVPWVCLLAFLLVKSGSPLKRDFFFMTTNGISIGEPGDFIIYYGVGSLIGIITLVAGRRGACHHICWMAPFMILGKKISSVLRLPSMQIRARKERCTGCRLCTRNCPMSLEVDRMVKAGTIKDADCILCGECIDNCPEHVLEYRFFNHRSLQSWLFGYESRQIVL